MASINLSNIIKRFGDTQTIHNVNLSIESGEFVVFVGPSGCGKSTLLRMIAGLEEISLGELKIGEQVMNDVPPSQRGVAMVFQSYALYPHMTVAENMGYSLKVKKTPPKEIEHKVKLVAKALQLESLLERKPAQLSGGQRQRVAIGRAIIRDPDVFLFDEPLSNLDAELRVEMRLHIAKLHKELQSTMVYVTHDQVEAMTLADKIVVLRDGRVEQVGTPMELYYHPQNLFVAGFIGSPKMNFIPSKLISWETDSITVELGYNGQMISLPVSVPPMSAGEQITIGIRPEHLSREEADIALSFDTEVVERLGNSTYIFGQSCGVDNFKFLHQGDCIVEPNNSLTLYTSTDLIHIFDNNGQALVEKKFSKAI
ncbi:ABC transporter [Vibrio sp. HA2012]|uniref:ABC transporter ATP-binding protein n=1 Tax=Vibrio sp. HA2012 TaxID=1971595 RepID=UPI000C2C8D13|nr:sn-glycerol-3-phosphate ABC transporter ATP-binding protein UgpC [Vibrio sp. HA2012]PJC87168.1 ABC transporter [Vibrio sp. HA2012]